MKKLLLALSVFALVVPAMADIQDPPLNDYGPTRKLGRGLSNVLYGVTEFPHTIALLNQREGNSAAASYGIIKGIGRTVARFHYGIYEIATFPFPTHNGSFRPPYRSNIPWIHGGYTEFPPEIGWQTRKTYNEIDTVYP
jgi:putative exosortase-associated protein (TIGR04073 family)